MISSAKLHPSAGRQATRFTDRIEKSFLQLLAAADKAWLVLQETTHLMKHLPERGPGILPLTILGKK